MENYWIKMKLQRECDKEIIDSLFMEFSRYGLEVLKQMSIREIGAFDRFLDREYGENHVHSRRD